MTENRVLLVELATIAIVNGSRITEEALRKMAGHLPGTKVTRNFDDTDVVGKVLDTVVARGSLWARVEVAEGVDLALDKASLYGSISFVCKQDEWSESDAGIAQTVQGSGFERVIHDIEGVWATLVLENPDPVSPVRWEKKEGE